MDATTYQTSLSASSPFNSSLDRVVYDKVATFGQRQLASRVYVVMLGVLSAIDAILSSFRLVGSVVLLSGEGVSRNARNCATFAKLSVVANTVGIAAPKYYADSRPKLPLKERAKVLSGQVQQQFREITKKHHLSNPSRMSPAVKVLGTAVAVSLIGSVLYAFWPAAQEAVSEPTETITPEPPQLANIFHIIQELPSKGSTPPPERQVWKAAAARVAMVAGSALLTAVACGAVYIKTRSDTPLQRPQGEAEEPKTTPQPPIVPQKTAIDLTKLATKPKDDLVFAKEEFVAEVYRSCAWEQSSDEAEQFRSFYDELLRHPEVFQTKEANANGAQALANVAKAFDFTTTKIVLWRGAGQPMMPIAQNSLQNDVIQQYQQVCNDPSLQLFATKIQDFILSYPTAEQQALQGLTQKFSRGIFDKLKFVPVEQTLVLKIEKEEGRGDKKKNTKGKLAVKCEMCYQLHVNKDGENLIPLNAYYNGLGKMVIGDKAGQKYFYDRSRFYHLETKET